MYAQPRLQLSAQQVHARAEGLRRLGRGGAAAALGRLAGELFPPERTPSTALPLPH